MLSGWYFRITAVKVQVHHKCGGRWRDGASEQMSLTHQNLTRQRPKSFSRRFLWLGLAPDVFQQARPPPGHKVYHLLDAKSLVSTAARGDSEDKCSFPEWIIMLRLHYLAFRGWQKASPAPPHLYCNPTVNDIPEVLFRRQSLLHMNDDSFIHVLVWISDDNLILFWCVQVCLDGDGFCELWWRRLLVLSACSMERWG